ncbi:Mis12 protein-domain-containing protein [Cladorrhinum sp. PSN259]|nr:Mis12 protein-domain-containing protein [Cladorrhinum sp. PSN259]
MASRSDTELLTEHFGYPPVSLLDQIINTLNALAERALSSIESGLLNAPPAALGFRPPKYPAPGGGGGGGAPYDAVTQHRQEVESGVHALETLLFASIDRDFDLFEIMVMRNVLTVSQKELDWVTLRHYEGLKFDDDDDDEEEKGKEGSGDSSAEEGVNALRRRVQASLRLRTMLEAERARNEGLLKEMRRLVGSGNIKQEVTETGQKEEGNGGKAFGFLLGDLGLQGDKETPMSTTAAFGVSQLEGLRGLSKELRAVMKELGREEDQGEDEDDTKSWRRERLEYIEGATRKHLESVRGLELGANGEVRDEEEVVVGRGKKKLSGGIKEVENLERVVGLLGIESEKDKGQEKEEGEGEAMDES